jgi:hypothetical protein
MKARQAPNTELNAKGISETLPDGNYLTTPKWGYSEREVVVKNGKVYLVGIDDYSFYQYDFFVVNDIIKAL